MRKTLALVIATVVLAGAVSTSGAAQAAPDPDAARAASRAIGTAPAPHTPEPDLITPPVPRPKPFEAAPPSIAPHKAVTPPDFGPNERILSAYHRGKLSRDDAVRYGLTALRSPRAVPAHLRQTGAIRDPQRYLTYLSMLAASVEPEAARMIAPDVEIGRAHV